MYICKVVEKDQRERNKRKDKIRGRDSTKSARLRNEIGDRLKEFGVIE